MLPPGARLKAGLLPIGAASVALALCVYAAYQWRYVHTYVTTDNAQLEGTIVAVRARVSGVVERVMVAENEPVGRGAPLVQIRPDEFDQRARQARAEYSALLANAGKAGGPGVFDSQIRGATASSQAARASVQQLQATLANAHDDLTRAENLAAQGVMSRQALDAARARVAVLKGSVQGAMDSSTAAQQNTIAQQAGLRTQVYRIAAAQAQLAVAEIQLGDTRIDAPVKGVVSKKSVETGQFVSAGQQLMSVADTSDIWIIASLKETDVGRVAVGQRVNVVVDAYPERELQGKVASLGAATGAKFSLLPQENASGNFTKVVQRIPVKILLDQAPTQALLLRPGMSAFVEIKTAGN
ncbi:MAG: HlyD family secretion protein [Pseudomonadota bacterium]|nr:HlyD family secretion protein [Pseudomonadota bacterium]